MTDRKTWTYSVGRWGVSRVRVYERYPGGPLQIEWTGGKRQTLANLAQKPITDRGLAKRVANRLSERLEQEAHRGAAKRILDDLAPRPLRELFRRYHDAKESGWSEEHARVQRQVRDWWLRQLGAQRSIQEITEAVVERTVLEAGDREGWSGRTRAKYLRYIKAAFRYGHRKLRWLKEDQDLKGVELPKANSGGPSYEPGDIPKLRAAAPSISVEAEAALEVAYDTQARSRALRHLKASDVDGVLVTFRDEHDKVGRTRVAVLSETAANAVRRLKEAHPERDWLFERDGEPITYDALLWMLRSVEEAAGIEHVTGRGWHAIRRRAITDARRAAGDMGVVSRQSGTDEATLRRIYEQDDLSPKRDLARAMERLRRET